MGIFSFWRSSGVPDHRGATSRRAERRAQGAVGTPDDRSFEAVEIRGHALACSAARALAGKRFLVADAPSLPLESCNVRCRCTYSNHADRRQDPRRSADVGVSSRFYVGPERRSGLDRRGRFGRGGDDDYYGFMRRRSGDS